MPNERFRAAGRFATKHLVASILVALICAALVFYLWYPHPFDKLAGGRQLFFLVISVDVIIGPALSFAVYNPRKRRTELWRDLGTIFVLQIAALTYGLYSVTQARPLWLAFEGDRFRIVSVPDIEMSDLVKAPPTLSRLSWTGPRPLGVRLAEPTDPEFLQSIQLSLQGIHPAFRPERWVDYQLQREGVIRQAKSIAELRRKHPSLSALIDDGVRQSGRREDELGYLPFVGQFASDWVVVISLRDAAPVAYLPLDGW